MEDDCRLSLQSGIGVKSIYNEMAGVVDPKNKYAIIKKYRFPKTEDLKLGHCLVAHGERLGRDYAAL